MAAIPSFLTRREKVIAEALEHLHSADEAISDLIRRVGPFTVKVHRDRFELLVRSILSQQISMKAAQSVEQAGRATERLRHDAASDCRTASVGDAGRRVIGPEDRISL